MISVLLELNSGGIWLAQGNHRLCTEKTQLESFVLYAYGAVLHSCRCDDTTQNVSRACGVIMKQRSLLPLFITSRVTRLHPASPGTVASFLCRYDISHNVGPTQNYKPSHHWDSDPVNWGHHRVIYGVVYWDRHTTSCNQSSRSATFPRLDFLTS